MANPPTATDPAKAFKDRIAELEASLANATKARDSAHALVDQLTKERDAARSDADSTGKKLGQVLGELRKSQSALAPRASSGGAKALFGDRPWLNIKVDRPDDFDGPTNASDANDLPNAPTNQTK